MVRHSTFSLICAFWVFLTNSSFGQEIPLLSTALQRTTVLLTNGQHAYQLPDLEIGKKYHLQITDVSYADICLPSIESEVSKRLIKQTDYFEIFQFKAVETTMNVEFALSCLPDNSSSKEFWVTIECKDCLPASQSRSMQGLEVRQNADAEHLIKEVFLGGNCFDVENITSKGQDVQFGVFSNATLGTGEVDHNLFSSKVDLLQNQEGIILSTGLATEAEGPNASARTGKTVNSGKGDRDLARLIGTSNIHDAVALEFDFTPTVEEISFEYVFASEEYCEYVGSEFNDVFGFFISGPGINGTFENGAINIATLPNSNEYVSINSVNFEATREYYIKNARPFTAVGCRERFGGKPVENLIEYDGLTTMLTAVANVIPCETYHIKLVIGDLNDGVWDSAVLLKANSFNAGGNVTANVNVPGAVDPTASIAFEGCQDATIVFNRTESDMSTPLEVNFVVSDSSTAISGVDYLPFSTSLTIPRGQMSIELPIVTIDDGEDELPESIILELDQACSCEAKKVEFHIEESPSLVANLENISTCPGGIVNLQPILEGGIGEPSYIWENGKDTERITETINEETSFTVTVTDQCNSIDVATITVLIEEPTATIQGAQKICNGEQEGEIEVNLSGSGPWNLTYTRDGEEQPVIEVVESPFLLQDSIAGNYKIVTAEGGGCIAEGTGEADLQVSQISIDVATQHPKCFNSEDGSITTTIGGTGQDLQFEWTNGSTERNIFDVEIGVYGISVTDNLNCVATIDSIELIAPPAITAAITADEKIDCYNLYIEAPEIEIEGGTPGYAQQIFDATTDELMEEDSISSGTFLVKITDALGCELEESFLVTADTIKPNAVASGKDNLSCKVLETNLSGFGSSEGTQYAPLWTTSDGNITSDETTLTPIVDQPGTYHLVVTNLDNGCQARASNTIVGDYVAPIFSIGSPATLNCQVKEIALEGTVASPAANFSLEWTAANEEIISSGLTARVDTEGLYNLSVLNEENGCSGELTVEVQQDTTAPQIDLANNFFLTCSDPFVTLAPAIQDLEQEEFGFSWMANTSGEEMEEVSRITLDLEISQPGTYELIVNDLSNFCISSTIATVQMDTIAPVAEAGNSFVFTCDLGSASLQGDALTENIYRWTTQDGVLLLGEETLSPLIGRAGEYELAVISGSNGCTATDRVQILEDPNRPEAVIAPPAPLNCINETISLDAVGSTQGAIINYRWSTIDGTLLEMDNPTRPVVGSAGTYKLEVLNTESRCIGETEVVVQLDTISPIARISPIKDFDCHTTAVELDATGSSKGEDFIYAWNTTNGSIVQGATSLFPTIGQPGSYTLLITSNINGCTKEQSLQVSENVPRSLAVEKVDPPCPNETGFIQVDNVEGGIGPYRYSINGGATYQEASQFDRIPAGNYTLSVMDDNGCELKDQVNITAPAPLELKVAPETALTLGDSINIDLFTNIPDNEIADIEWTPALGLSCDDCLQPMVKPLRTQEYQVRLMDINGCEIDATTRFLVDANPQVYLPTAFSPNNADGVNDRFTVFAKSSSVQLVKTLRIFDRWGNLVFERSNFAPNDLELGWDGRFNSRLLRPQVFVYLAEVTMIDNRDVTFRGDVALVE